MYVQVSDCNTSGENKLADKIRDYVSLTCGSSIITQLRNMALL